MRTLILLAGLFCSSVYAQQAVRQMPVVCMHILDFASTVEEFGEMPMLRGDSVRFTEKDPRSNIMVLFLNPNTKTWTLAERINQEVVCVVAVGEQLEPLDRDGNSWEQSNRFQGVLFNKELRKHGLIK